MRASLLLLLPAMLDAGCTAREHSLAHPSRSDSRVIDGVALEGAGAAVSAYDALFRIRPEWFRSPAGSAREIMLWIDGGPLELGYLRQLSAGAIARIERLSASDAYSRWGSRAGGSEVLLVTIRTGLR